MQAINLNSSHLFVNWSIAYNFSQFFFECTNITCDISYLCSFSLTTLLEICINRQISSMCPWNIKWNNSFWFCWTNWLINVEIFVFLEYIICSIILINIKLHSWKWALLLLNFLHGMKLVIERLWFLSHFIPPLFNLWMQILGFIDLFSDNHFLHIWLCNFCILAHVWFQTSKFGKMCGH